MSGDHIGWLLWSAAAAWKTAFRDEMVARGHAWYAEARGAMLQHIPLSGVKQSQIVAKAGITKQAVQQLLIELEGDGVIMRRSDPGDGRGKIIEFTAKGRTAVQDASHAKHSVEEAIRSALGPAEFEVLTRLLKKLDTEQDQS